MKYLPILFVFFLTSCETLVNTIPASELPRQESQLTLFSFISPQDTVILVKVSQTSPLFGDIPFSSGNTYTVVNGDTLYGSGDSYGLATVLISDGAKSMQVPFDTHNQVYSLPTRQFPIVAGRTYTLKASDEKRTATASCTIPNDQVLIQKHTLDTTISVLFGQRDTTVTLSFVWDDLRGKSNYYRVRAFELIEYSEVKVDTNELFLVENRRNARSYFNWSGNDTRSVYQSDANLDGTRFSSPQGRKPLVDLSAYVRDPNAVKPQRGPESKGIYMQLLNTDVNYYQFHRSVSQQRGDTPFTEPSLVYTNVTGGLGVFAGYNQYVKVINP